ncbi:general stress protein [Mesobaculum littorinae]|uniref:General stress protein n=1 Tax=Mesobaculum littorinae TaxID=2486419 RepID=A0A438AKG9_9RHOB|nr:pyridoxamine 5'-phosphate oxidase family protein [Mesobaculum littorinae]RVV99208.1 general stress protein [Mesobaculum littorinae]
MPTPQELEHKLWKNLASDMTVMLGLETALDDHPRPMTAILDEEGEEHGPLWFFTSRKASLSKALGSPSPAIASFVSKGHDIFATIRGTLREDTDPQVVERLWNPHVAAWYEEGKDDPQLVLLRMDLSSAEIWENGSSLVAGVKSLFGSDPKSDYQDKVADVPLR